MRTPGVTHPRSRALTWGLSERIPANAGLTAPLAVLLGIYLVAAGSAPVAPGLPFRSAWLAAVVPAAAALLGSRAAPEGVAGRGVFWRALVAGAAGGLAVVAARLAPVARPVTGPADLLGALVVAGVVVGALAGTGRRRHPVALDCLALEAAVAAGLTDVSLFQGLAMRDLRLYLDAGARFLAGAPVYLAEPLRGSLPDPTHFPFVYPPLTLPLFGALARLPLAAAELLWETAGSLAAIGSLRALGLPWRWSIVLLAWPPFAQGLYVGNVAVPAFLLFALAFWRGEVLVLGPVFKLQAGVPALWLVRQRRLAALFAGLFVLLALVLVSVPLTGIDRWTQWIDGLFAYQRSQASFPSTFYAYALPRFLPYAVYLVLAAFAVLAALIPGGRSGLSALGLASIVASPSLYTHGFLPGLPALLALKPSLLWLALGLTSALPVPGWWLAVALGGLGLASARLRHDPADADLHPLGHEAAAWPAREASSSAPAR